MPVAVVSASTTEKALAHAAKVASSLREGGFPATAIADAPSAGDPATRLESLARAVETCRFWEDAIAPRSATGEIVIVARRDPPSGGAAWPEVERSLYRIASGSSPALVEIRITGEEPDPERSAEAVKGAIARRKKMESRPLAAKPARKEGKR